MEVCNSDSIDPALLIVQTTDHGPALTQFKALIELNLVWQDQLYRKSMLTCLVRREISLRK